MLARHPELSWFCYEDQGYKHLPGMLAWRVSKLFRSGLWPTPEPVPVSLDVELKHKALWCYTSQIPPLEQDHGLTRRLEAHVPEQFWRLAPPARLGADGRSLTTCPAHPVASCPPAHLAPPGAGLGV